MNLAPQRLQYQLLAHASRRARYSGLPRAVSTTAVTIPARRPTTKASGSTGKPRMQHPSQTSRPITTGLELDRGGALLRAASVAETPFELAVPTPKPPEVMPKPVELDRVSETPCSYTTDDFDTSED